MSPQSLADDLAYIRDLAEAGEKAPLLGGRYLVWWGALTTLAYLAQYAILERLVGLPPQALSFLWGGYVILGLGGSFSMHRTFGPGKPGAASTGNRVSALVWKSAGLFLGAYFTGTFFKAALGPADFDPFIWSLPLVVGVYGLAQYAGGVMAGSPVLTRAGQAALVATIPAVMLVGSPLAWLLGAAVAAFCILLPGIVLMRNEPSATV
nr:hypothetical protein [uncultured Hyphomonas sp.]